MGLYYNPPSPNIGAAQPLAPPQKTPPSGPIPSNPVFGAASLAATLVAAWAASAAPLPQTAPHLIPAAPASGPPPQLQTVPAAVLVSWLPPDPQPPAAVNLRPPIAGPAPQNPRFAGARIPDGLLVSWLPPPPRPPAVVNLNPPISAPVAQNPPWSGGIDVAWESGDDPTPIVLGARIAPLLPVASASSVPPARQPWAALLASWSPAPPQPQRASRLTPPISGAVPTNPPFVGGFDIAWEWQDEPAPIFLPTRVLPAAPIADNPPFAAGIDIAWGDEPVPIILPPRLVPGAAIADNPPFRGGIDIAWGSEDETPIIPRARLAPLLPVISAPYVPVGTNVPRAVLVSWLPAAPPPPVASNLNPPISGAASQNPPFAGGIDIAWEWQDEPPPIVTAPRVLPTAAAADNPPFQGGIDIAWESGDDAPQIVLGARIAPLIPIVSAVYVPVGAHIPQAVLASWLPPAPQRALAAKQTPPVSGAIPDNPPFAAGINVVWDDEPFAAATPPNPARLAPPISGPLPESVPVGARAPLAVFVAWLPPPPRPPQAINLNPPISAAIADNPPFAVGHLDISWDDEPFTAAMPPQPARLTPPISGPAPDVRKFLTLLGVR